MEDLPMSKYTSEYVLVRKFCSLLNEENSPWGKLKFVEEFYHPSGRTDLVATDENNNLFAFEMKLEKWKVALIQAYRNTSFAHQSYVVVPEAIAKKAIKYEDQFKRRSVGLCFVNREGIIKLVEANHNESLQPWLTEKAKYVIGEKTSEN